MFSGIELQRVQEPGEPESGTQREMYGSLSSMHISPDLPSARRQQEPESPDFRPIDELDARAEAGGDEDEPVAMPARGNTTEFPRKDNIYQGKESLAFDESQSLVWTRHRPERCSFETQSLAVHILTGIGIGITAFIMEQIEHFLVHENVHLLQIIID